MLTSSDETRKRCALFIIDAMPVTSNPKPISAYRRTAVAKSSSSSEVKRQEPPAAQLRVALLGQLERRDGHAALG